MTSLHAEPRTVLGKKVKNLLKTGITPIHVYGTGVESLALQAGTVALRKVLIGAGKSRPVSLQVESEATPFICFVREVQFDPLNEQVRHVDFLRVDITQRMTFQVPVRVRGEAPAVRKGGSLLLMAREVTVECLPLEAPAALEADVSGLEEFGTGIRASQLNLPAGVTLVTDPDQVVVQAMAPVKIVEPERPAAAAAGAAAAPAEGEAATEGTAKPAEGGAKPAEGKGRGAKE
ncbi:MAG: 50S ribosomal protein L25 [Dehalococcoidia bacterium]|nr:50S ribosomal protein L25 [Dehalococcoidia bacterium]